MHKSFGRMLRAAVATLAIGAFGSVAEADEIGINFEGGNNAGAPTAMLPTDVAGVIHQPDWNNAAGAGGTSNGLVNQSGVSTSASVTWHADNTWGSKTGTSDGDHKLYNGYLDATGTSATTVAVSGLHAAGFTGTYSVLVYYTGDSVGAGRSGAYTINGITETGLDNTGFNGTYIQAIPGNDNNGNYLLFEGLTGDSFTLSATPLNTSGTNRSPVNAIQIATGTVPEPTSLALAGIGLLSALGYSWKRRKATA
jgi:hypothetical protein